MPVLCFSWLFIQQFLNMFDFLPSKLTKICLLRKEISDQHVCFLICSTLPRTMRITKINLHLLLLNKEFMLSHLFSSIISHRQGHLFRQGFQLHGNSLSNGFSIPLFQWCQYDGPSCPLNNRTNC